MSKKKTKSTEIQPLRHLSEEEAQDMRLQLDEMVKHRKELAAAGKSPPTVTVEERIAESNASKNIISLADVMKTVLPDLRAMSEKASAFIEETKDKIRSVEPAFCEDHEKQELEIDEEATIGQSWKNRTLTLVMKGCPLCQKEAEEVYKRAFWLDRGIPNTVLHATLVNYNTEGSPDRARVLKRFKNQIAKGSGFIFAVGLYGTGKSHLAAATIRAAGDGIFVTLHDLVGELRQTYSDNTGQDEMVDRYRKAKVLVIDELTKEIKGVDIPPLLYRVLGYRYEESLLTVITSNETIEECMSILGPKLRDRIRTNYTIANFTWQSHREAS